MPQLPRSMPQAQRPYCSYQGRSRPRLWTIRIRSAAGHAGVLGVERGGVARRQQHDHVSGEGDEDNEGYRLDKPPQHEFGHDRTLPTGSRARGRLNRPRAPNRTTYLDMYHS